MSLADLVPIPPKELMNQNLSAARESTMLDVFGKPGPLTGQCAKPAPALAKRLRTGVDVGPFKVTGLDFAVESLRQACNELEELLPDVHAGLRTAGMLCVRWRNHNHGHYSNHSWGAAIDLYFGAGVVDQGVHLTQRGVLAFAPFLMKRGWYWGAEFSGDSVDSMHFELAEETILKLATTM